MLCNDLSVGWAKHKIPVINEVDDEDLDERFIYTPETIHEADFNPCKGGCNCDSICLPGSCPCVDQSTIKLFKHKIDLSEGFPGFYDQILFECNAATCRGCRGMCSQRLTPNDDSFDLQVELYKTPFAGFAVRSLQYIESGSFVGEFVGEVVSKIQQENRPHDYAYHLWEGEDYYVDPFTYGNITRFFNHSCFRNLEPFRYYSRHRENSRPSIGFFACRDVLPSHDLTIDYGKQWWIGRITQSYDEENRPFYCYCGTEICQNPSPNVKINLMAEGLKERMMKRVRSDHKKLRKWKREQKVQRNEAISSVGDKEGSK